MKKKLTLVCCLLCTVLIATACTVPAASGDASSDASRGSQITISESQALSSSSMQNQSMDSDNATDAAVAPPENFDLVQLPADDAGVVALGEHMLTKSQEAAIITLVENVVAGYREGWLPLSGGENTAKGLDQPLPEGMQLPETVSYGDIAMTTDGNDEWGGGMKATLKLMDGSSMYIWVDQTKDDQLGDIIFINQVGFMMP